MVASAFRNIDFSGTRPFTIGIVVRHHPDGRPQPVSLRHLCNDLNLAKGDGLFTFCRDTATAYRIDNGTGGLVGSNRTVVDAFCGAGPISLTEFISVPCPANTRL